MFLAQEISKIHSKYSPNADSINLTKFEREKCTKGNTLDNTYKENTLLGNLRKTLGKISDFIF